MPFNAQHKRLQSADVQGMFFQRLEEQMNANMLEDLAIKATSTHSSGEDYAWLGNVKGMSEWLGARQFQTLREFQYFIKNRKWEDSLAIKEEDYEFDKLGQIIARINELSDAAGNHPLELLTELIIAGENTPCYDGESFYDTDHAEGESGTQSNIVSVDISSLPIPADAHGSTTDPSAQELEKCLLKAIQAMMGFKNDQGRPINQRAKRFAMHVPISYLSSSLGATGNPSFTNGYINTLVSNNQRFQIDVYSDPLLTWTNKFALHRIDASMKPFVFQEARPINMKPPLSYDSEHHTLNDEHLFPIDGIYNVGYGLWQQSVLVQLT